MLDLTIKCKPKRMKKEEKHIHMDLCVGVVRSRMMRPNWTCNVRMFFWTLFYTVGLLVNPPRLSGLRTFCLTLWADNSRTCRSHGCYVYVSMWIEPWKRRRLD